MNVQRVCEEFQITGEYKSCETLKNGHINDTYKVVYVRHNEDKVYIVQRINMNVFPHPEWIMENIDEVTNYIRNKIKSTGATAKRAVLHFQVTKEGKNFYINEEGFWRSYRFIDESITYNNDYTLEVMENAGHAFGNFQTMLSDFPAADLHEIIKDFHNTKKRFDNLFEAYEKDVMGRAGEVEKEIDFFRKNRKFGQHLTELLEEGKLPLRVTHNDTKCNNVLFDEHDNSPLAVIDLDTVMPGLIMHDFGDSIRYGANFADEDEKDLSKVGLDFAKYEAFTKGFMSEVKDTVTPAEVENMALGAVAMTMECGSRFLEDYLKGDVYFKTSRDKHNLDRARCQIRLAEDMIENFDKMNEIVKKYAK